MDEDPESVVLPAVQRCVDELSSAGGAGSAEDRAALVRRLADLLRAALGVPPEPDADRLALQLACRLWNVPLRAPLGQLTARLCRRLAAELLLLLPARPLPLEGATQVLVTAARQCVAGGELARALALSERALRDLLLRRAAVESQLATFSRRADTLRRLAELEQARYGCLMVRAEALFLREDWDGADEAVREAGGARDASPDQLEYMQRLLFNFGLRRYRQQSWQQAVQWLTRSMEIGQSLPRSERHAELRARTLDLLARSHMMLAQPADLDRAMQLLQLAFSESASLTLRLLILACELRRGLPEDDPARSLQHCVQDATDWCRQPDDFVRLSDLLVQHGRLKEALTVLTEAAGQGCNGDICRRTVYIQLQLDRPQAALTTLSEYCAQPAEKKDGDPVSGQVAALEARAGEMLEAGQLEPAVQLLQTLADLTDLDSETAARLLRNVGRCWRGQGRLADAESALRRSLQLQPGHPAALYMLLQLLIATERADAAAQVVPLIEAAQDWAALARLWRSLCGFALGRQMSHVYEALLEAVLRHLDRPEDALQLAQCLVRSRIESLESEQEGEVPAPGPLIAAMESALLVVRRCQAEDHTVDSGGDGSAGVWFSDVAWNVAVHGELGPAERCRLFTLSRLFLAATNTQDPSDLSLCRMAALMAAAAALEAARQPGIIQTQKKAHLRDAVCCVEECRSLTERLGGATAAWAHHSALILYEFEAKAGLTSPDLGDLLGAAAGRPELDAHTLETMAGLAPEPALAVTALRAAADRLLRVESTDWDRLAAIQTRYISLMLEHADAPGLPSDVVFRAVLAVRDGIRRADGRYPNMTTLFVMTRTWNHAVRLCVQGDTLQANRWAAAARSMASLLAAQNDWYRHHMRLLPTDGEPPPPAAAAGFSRAGPAPRHVRDLPGTGRHEDSGPAGPKLRRTDGSGSGADVRAGEAGFGGGGGPSAAAGESSEDAAPAAAGLTGSAGFTPQEGVWTDAGGAGTVGPKAETRPAGQACPAPPETCDAGQGSNPFEIGPIYIDSDP